MGKNVTSPLNVAEIKERLDQGKVKVKGVKATKKKARSVAGVAGVNGKITDANIVAWLKTQDEPITSTQLRDGIGFKSRTQGRRVMRRLARAKVVRITTKQVSDKRAIFMFQIA